MKKLFYLVVMFALFGVWACDSSNGSSGGGTTIPNTITIQGENLLYVDNTTQFKAVLNPDNFTSEEIVWASDNETVGTIDTTGLFTAKAEGKVNITASAGGVTSSPFIVSVVRQPDSVIIDSSSPTEVNVGESITLLYAIEPADIQYKEVVWNVDNTTIASINKDTGVLIGNIAGTVNVTVTVNGVESTPYPVNVILPVESVTINGPATVSPLSKNTYTVTANPEGATVTNVEWSIENNTLATIDAATGELTTKNTAGQVTISVNVDGKTASKMINIEKVLYIYGNNTTSIGGIITLSAVNNTTSNLTWSSSNPAVATVENGVVTGKSAGSTNVTVTENGKSASITITIKNVPNGYEIDSNGAYHVYSVAGFKKWVEAVTAESGSYGYTSCYLYSDLDFSGETTDILINKSYYKGTFNGNGHIIKNYTISNGRGFIRNIASKGQVLNVTFDNANVTYTTEAGSWITSAGIVAYSASSGLIENVHVKNSKLTVNSNGSSNNVAMIVAEATEATIKNCTVTDSTITITGTMDNAGGIAGKSTNSTVISGCFVNNLTISAQGSNYNTTGIGGIVGQQQDQAIVSDTVIGCGVANTTITSTGTKGRVGGLIGIGGRNLTASYFYGSVSNGNSAVALDFGLFGGTASTLYVKQKGGSVGTINGQNSTTLVDDTTVTWAQAVEKMNQALIDNGYTNFVYRYDATLGYPVIDYAK